MTEEVTQTTIYWAVFDNQGDLWYKTISPTERDAHNSLGKLTKIAKGNKFTIRKIKIEEVT